MTGINNALALAVRTPDLDFSTPLMKQARLREADTQNALAQVQLQYAPQRAEAEIEGARLGNQTSSLNLANATDRRNALAEYGKTGDDKSLRGQPDLHAQIITIRSGLDDIERKKYDERLTRNAKGAQRVLGIADPTERAAAWKDELDTALAEKRIDQATHTRLSASKPDELTLGTIVKAGLSLQSAIELDQKDKDRQVGREFSANLGKVFAPAGTAPATVPATASTPAPAASAATPRGLRNNNPLNIEAGKFTEGLPGYAGSDGRFAKFQSPEQGIAAADKLLVSYNTNQGIDTVQGVINRWAPATENDTSGYAKFVAAKIGVKPGDKIDLSDPTVRQNLIAAMGEFENGRPISGAKAGTSTPQFDASNPTLGYKVREQLFPGEEAYFRSNPHVSGMAAETGDIILNPHSAPGVNREAVARNEAMRLWMRENKVVPDFEITPQQRSAFAGTAYANDDAALKQTIAARIYSGDPSAQATPEQQAYVQRLKQSGGQPSTRTAGTITPASASQHIGGVPSAQLLPFLAQAASMPGIPKEGREMATELMKTILSEAKPSEKQKHYLTYVKQETDAGRVPMTQFEYEKELAESGSTKNTVKIDQKAESAAEIERRGGLAKQLTAMADSGREAADQEQLVGRLGSLLEKSGTGPNIALTQWVRSNTGIKLSDKADAAEAATAIINYLKPRMRAPGSGATSDRDMTIFANAIPSLLSTTEGKRIVIETLGGMYAIQRARGEIAERWQVGDIDDKKAMTELRGLQDPFKNFREFQSKREGKSGVQTAEVPVFETPEDMKAALEAKVIKPGDEYRTRDGRFGTAQ